MLLFECVKLGQWIRPCSQLVQRVDIVWHNWCILPYTCPHNVLRSSSYYHDNMYVSDFCMQKRTLWHQLWGPHTLQSLTLQQLY